MGRKLVLLCVLFLCALSVNAQGSILGSSKRDVLAANVDNHLSSTKITAIANPAEGGEITGAGEYNAGDGVTLTAIPNKDFVFLNWSENGEVLSTDNPYTFFIEEDPEPPVITFDRIINNESAGLVEPGRYEIIGDVDDMYELTFIMNVINNSSESIELACEKNIISITEGVGHNFCFVYCFPDNASSTEITIDPLSSLDPDNPYYPYQFSAHFKPYDANTWELLPPGAELTVQYIFTMEGDEPMVFEFYFKYDPSLSKNTDAVALSDNERVILANFGSFAAPTDVTATIENSSDVILTWSAVEYALSYNIYRDGILIDNAVETSYIDKGLNPYSEYCYTLTAVRNETESEQSETICVTTEDLPISVPANVTATAGGQTSIILAWDDVDNAMSYNIYRAGEFLKNVNISTYTDNGLENNTEYCYSVSAVRNETETEHSESVCATTTDYPISIPTNVTATAESTSSIVLTWNAVENALSYNVYRDGCFLANVTMNSYIDINLEIYTEYCYRVSALRHETETAKSIERCATTFDLPITAPVNLAASAVGERTIVLTWDSVENALSYNVYRDGELLANVANKTYTDEELEYETEYCYTVTAVRNESESEHSDELCATTSPDAISENEMAFEFYPNPVSETLTINTDGEIEEITVYNISGSMIYQSDMIEGSALNVSTYDEGTYLLRVRIDDRYITRTFIKK